MTEPRALSDAWNEGCRYGYTYADDPTGGRANPYATQRLEPVVPRAEVLALIESTMERFRGRSTCDPAVVIEALVARVRAME